MENKALALLGSKHIRSVMANRTADIPDRKIHLNIG